MDDASFGNELGLDRYLTFLFFPVDDITGFGINSGETDISETGLLPERH